MATMNSGNGLSGDSAGAGCGVIAMVAAAGVNTQARASRFFTRSAPAMRLSD